MPIPAEPPVAFPTFSKKDSDPGNQPSLPSLTSGQVENDPNKIAPLVTYIEPSKKQIQRMIRLNSPDAEVKSTLQCSQHTQ